MYNCVVLDGYSVNHGELSWEKLGEICALTVYDRTSPELFYERTADADIIITNKVPITGERISRLPKLKYITVLATGYNIIDTAAAGARGIPVSNVPEYSTNEVAETVFAMLLEIEKQIAGHNASVQSGKWSGCADFCFWNGTLHSLAGKTLGIIGDGKIGKKVAQLARAFDMNVLACGRTEKPGRVSLEEVLAGSDYISLHCPLTPETKGLISEKTLCRMKDGVIIINTSRGPVVNSSDLRAALLSKKVAFAAVDVLETEPPVGGNPLIGLENCIVTPHIAWAALEARERLIRETVGNVSAFINGQPKNTVC